MGQRRLRGRHGESMRVYRQPAGFRRGFVSPYSWSRATSVRLGIDRRSAARVWLSSQLASAARIRCAPRT